MPLRSVCRGTGFRTVSATRHIVRPIQRRVRKFLALRERDPGSSSNGPLNFAPISRAAIWKSTVADGTALRSVESTSDALVFSTRIVDRPAAAGEGQRARQRAAETGRRQATSPRAAPRNAAVHMLTCLSRSN